MRCPSQHGYLSAVLQGWLNQMHNIQSLSVLLLTTTSISSSSSFPNGEQGRQCRAVVTGGICRMVERRGERRREGKRTTHDTYNRKKKTKNNHLMGAWNPWLNKQLALSPLFSPLAVWQTTVTPPRRQTQTQHLWLVVRHTLCARSPHISTFILSGNRVIEWVASRSLSHKDEAKCEHACVCVCKRGIDLSTAKRIKESRQACPRFCHVINMVSMCLSLCCCIIWSSLCAMQNSSVLKQVIDELF